MKALIVAGEASGDIYGAKLASVLRERVPDIQISGMGGDRMQQNGVELVAHYRSVAVVGVFEVVTKLVSLMKTFQVLTRWVDANAPDFVVLIDFPDFNFRLARFLKKHKGIPIFYFISPQVWAWRKNRIHFLKDHVNLMITILPFEKAMYDEADVPAVYIGHPLVEIVRNELIGQNPFPHGSIPIVGFMAGSRDTEVKRHLPILLETAKRLQQKIEFEPILIWAPSLAEKDYDIPPWIRIVKEDRYRAMEAADFLLIASGTSTLESAIVGTPFIIVYKVGALSWQLGKFLVRVPFYGLVNWIAQTKVVPEFIQGQMKPELLAAETEKYLRDQMLRIRLKQQLMKVVALLGPPGAMERAADAILNLCSAGVVPAESRPEASDT